MAVSDCLSREPKKQYDTCTCSMIENEIYMYVESVSANIPIYDTRIKSTYDATQNDKEMQNVISFNKKLVARKRERSEKYDENYSVTLINFLLSMECCCIEIILSYKRDSA